MLDTNFIINQSSKFLSTPYDIIQFTIGILGAITTIACFIPQCIKTLITKDTSGLSKWFFIFALVSSIFWFCIGGMSIANPFINIESNGVVSQTAINNGILAGLPPIITNVVTFIVNICILTIKLINIKNAKNKKISEIEYCLQLKKEKENKKLAT